MTSSPLRSKSTYHTRSVSSPSTLHPFIPHANQHLSLSGLQIMYDHLEDLLLLPHTQQAFAQQRNEKWVEVVLEKYLRLLDICVTAKDVSSQTKEDVRGLLSILRRRRDTNEFSGHLNSRMKSKKVIQKSLKDLKCFKSSHTSIAHGKSQEILDSLNEIEAATAAVLESVLSYMSGTKVESSLSGFSLVSKLVHQRSIALKDDQTSTNVFEKLDAALHKLNHHKMSKSDNAVHVENAHIQLEKMEPSIQDIEEGLECLFRRLIKTRVILLNILNH